jgi:hypothetical protein
MAMRKAPFPALRVPKNAILGYAILVKAILGNAILE